MPTYVYETMGEDVRRFEVAQSMRDEPLRFHPETGEPVRRVITGGYGFIAGGERDAGGAAAAPLSSAPRSGCCGGGCGCR